MQLQFMDSHYFCSCNFLGHSMLPTFLRRIILVPGRDICLMDVYWSFNDISCKFFHFIVHENMKAINKYSMKQFFYKYKFEDFFACGIVIPSNYPTISRSWRNKRKSNSQLLCKYKVTKLHNIYFSVIIVYPADILCKDLVRYL